jgi:hypothetical protein
MKAAKVPRRESKESVLTSVSVKFVWSLEALHRRRYEASSRICGREEEKLSMVRMCWVATTEG